MSIELPEAADAAAPTRARVVDHPVERWTAWTLILFGGLLRFGYALHHNVNTDEPQHLHVAWAWTQGLLPYRDVFDNHSPLLSVLFAPVLAWLGPRADIVICMRQVMAPLILLTLWALWVLVRRLFGSRAALWSVAIAGVQPDFIERGVEYRTDVLWMALWTCCLAVLLVERPTRARAFAGGLLLGAAFATSLKTSLLAAGLAFAGVTTFLLVRAEVDRDARHDAAGNAGAALAGTLVVPGLLAAYFAARHAWSSLIYDLIYVPGLGQWESGQWLPLLAIPALPLLLWGALRIMRFGPNRRIGAARSVLFLTAACYWLGVETFWPLVTRQDWLPLVPMVAALATPLVLGLSGRLRSPTAGGWARAAWAVPVVIVVAEVVTVTAAEPVWKDKTSLEMQTLGELLRLTRPTEPVADVRGEAIFRRRPDYPVFEAIALARIRNGLLRDDIAERALATGTTVAYRDIDEWPSRGRRFLNDHYVSVGLWRVVGQWLAPAPRSKSMARAFDILIPARYTIVTARGAARGSLDDTPFTGPRVLRMGRHTYAGAPGEDRAVVLWAPAIERGFKPVLR